MSLAMEIEMAGNFYDILGVKQDSTPDAIRGAYRKLAMKWHPDRNPGDKHSEQRFKEINEAYEVLKDRDKRAAYDRFGHAAFNREDDTGSGFSANFGFTFSDLFENVFMGGAGARRDGRV